MSSLVIDLYIIHFVSQTSRHQGVLLPLKQEHSQSMATPAKTYF